jgi:hypothetical protein
LVVLLLCRLVWQQTVTVLALGSKMLCPDVWPWHQL